VRCLVFFCASAAERFLPDNHERICHRASCHLAGAMELSADNFDTLSAGKSVFVKFQAPW